MKKLIMSFLLLIFVIGCQKDEIIDQTVKPQVNEDKTEFFDDVNDDSNNIDRAITIGSRDGFTDIVFFRGSMTTDNYLNTSTSGEPRTYVIYNKKKIQKVTMEKTTKNDINLSGVMMRHYLVKITFTDNDSLKFTAFSKLSSNNFSFIPTGDNVLTDSHESKYIKISMSSTGGTNVTYNFFRNENIRYSTWNIFKENIRVSTRQLEPLNKNSRIFIPPQIH